MALNLSRAERSQLRSDLALADPYDEGDLVLCTLDGPKADMDRWRATTAKKLLEQDQKEKESAGLPLEPESTPQSERRRRI
jgi:hypothetical protein